MKNYRLVISGISQHWRQMLEVAFLEDSIFEIAGSVSSHDLINSAVSSCPEAVIWKPDEEYGMLGTIAELKSKCPFTVPVIIVADPRGIDFVKLVKVGTRGCLPLRLLPRQIVAIVELIMLAGVLCLPRLDPEDFDRPLQNGEEPFLNSLTDREREIIPLLQQNLLNREIAQNLFISETTVKTHMRSIFRKLGVRNRNEAIALFYSQGLVGR